MNNLILLKFDYKNESKETLLTMFLEEQKQSEVNKHRMLGIIDALLAKTATNWMKTALLNYKNTMLTEKGEN